MYKGTHIASLAIWLCFIKFSLVLHSDSNKFIKNNAIWKMIWLILIGLVHVQFAFGIDLNSTLKDYIANCKEYDAVNGYNYTHFFVLNEIDSESEQSKTSIVNLTFGVLATRDAHILLSNTLFPAVNDSVYEFVLGAGTNSFCEVRKKMKKSPLKHVACKLFPSPINPSPFNIVVHRTGLIEVYDMGQSVPLISVQDDEMVHVKYVSFGSWSSAQSKWFYDCRKEDGLIEGDVIVAEDGGVSLRRKFIERYQSGFANDVITFIIEAEVLEVDFIARKSAMKTRMKFNLKWSDAASIWDPKDFSGKKTLRDSLSGLSPVQLVLLNGRTTLPSLHIDVTYRYIINSDGSAEAFSTETEFYTWCSEDMTTKNWPYDKNTCRIQIGTSSSNFNFTSSSEYVKVNNELLAWKANRIKMQIKQNRRNSQDENMLAPYIIYSVELSRNYNYYAIIFLTPLISAIIIMSLSYWTKGFFRIGLCLLATIILSVFYLGIAEYGPLLYVPRIMIYYNYAYVCACMGFFLFTLRAWLEKHTPRKALAHWFVECMDNVVFRSFLLMESQESISHLNAVQRAWVELSVMFDGIMFILTHLLLSVIIIKGL